MDTRLLNTLPPEAGFLTRIATFSVAYALHMLGDVMNHPDEAGAATLIDLHFGGMSSGGFEFKMPIVVHVASWARLDVLISANDVTNPRG